MGLLKKIRVRKASPTSNQLNSPLSQLHSTQIISHSTTSSQSPQHSLQSLQSLPPDTVVQEGLSNTYPKFREYHVVSTPKEYKEEQSFNWLTNKEITKMEMMNVDSFEICGTSASTEDIDVAYTNSCESDAVKRGYRDHDMHRFNRVQHVHHANHENLQRTAQIGNEACATKLCAPDVCKPATQTASPAQHDASQDTSWWGEWLFSCFVYSTPILEKPGEEPTVACSSASSDESDDDSDSNDSNDGSDDSSIPSCSREGEVLEVRLSKDDDVSDITSAASIDGSDSESEDSSCMH